MNLLSGWIPLWGVVFVAAAWAVPRRWHPHVLSLLGLAFLGAHDWRSLAAAGGLAVVSHLLVPGPGTRGWRVAVVTLAVAGLLAWTRRVGAQTPLPGSEGTADAVAILGLSYYGLRIIHVAVERYAGRLKACPLAEYLGYLLFLPAIVAGPIHTLREFLHDQSRRRWDSGLAAAGLERILYGVFKIVVLGNFLVSRHLNHWLETDSSLPPWTAEFLGLFSVASNGYFQFSGYSDIAVGLGRIAGYRLPENFNWPFLATNLRDFWQRWHASLSQWCRDHVFTPVSARFRSPWAGLVLSMLVLALWHELSLRYVAWGLWQAAGIGAWHAFQPLKRRLPGMRWVVARGALAFASCLLTMCWFIASYAFLRTDDLGEAVRILLTIVSLKGGFDV